MPGLSLFHCGSAASGGRRNLNLIVRGLDTGPATATRRFGRRLLARFNRDGRRQPVGVDRRRRFALTLFAAAAVAAAAATIVALARIRAIGVARLDLLLLLLVVAARLALAPVLARFAMFARFTVFALIPLLARLAAAGARIELVDVLELFFGVRFVALAALILEARARLVQNPEIVIRELEIIFGGDPVPGHLRVAREILVLLMKLLGIATRTIVDAVALVRPPRIALRPLAATAATATVLTIIDQRMSSSKPCYVSYGSASSMCGPSVAREPVGRRARPPFASAAGFYRVLAVGMSGTCPRS